MTPQSHPYERADMPIAWLTVSYWLAWVTLAAALLNLVTTYGRGLLNYQTLHNSDAAFISVFYRDVLARGSIAGWDLPTNPYFFPDMAIFIPLDFIANNSNLAVMLYAVAQLLLTLIGLLLLQRQLFGPARLPQTFMLLAFALCILLITTREHTFAYLPLMPSHHFGVLVVFPLATARLLRALQLAHHTGHPTGVHTSTRWYDLWLLLLLIVVTALSDSLFIIQFVLPAFVALLLWGKHKGITWLHWLLLAIALPLAAAAGQWLRQLLVPLDKLLLYADQQTEVAAQFANFWAWSLHFAADAPLFAIFWLTSLFALIAARFIAATRAQRLVVSLLLAALPITLASTWVSGNFTGGESSRYILAAIFLPLFTGWPLFLAVWLAHGEQRGNKERWLAIACNVAGLLLAGYALLHTSTSAIAAIPSYQDPFVACLERESAARGLRYGLAEYWQANYVTAITRGKLQIVSTTSALTPDLWNGNRHRYQLPFEFVVSNPAAAPQWQLHPELLRQKFGLPTDTFTCAASTISVYDRAHHPQFRHWFAHHPSLATLNAVGDEAELYGYTLSSIIEGVGVGLSLGANETWDQDEGTLAYAPLKQLSAGSYALRIDLFADNDDAGAWEVVALTPAGRELIATEAITATGKSSMTGYFDLKEAADVDVVVKYNGHGALYVDRIQMARVDPSQAAAFNFAEQTTPDEVPVAGAIHLVYPPPDSTVEGRATDFVWQWTGQPLADAQTFEVRLWRAGESIQYGAHDASLSQALIRQIGDTYILRLNLDGAYSMMQHGAGDYAWSVGVVTIAPTYQDLQIEATPSRLRVQP